MEQPLPDLSSIFACVPGFAGRAHVVKALEGGITNRNFLVACEAELFVVRLVAPETALLDIDRHREYEASVRAAELGIGPQVHAFVATYGCLVTRFVDGAALSSAEIGAHDRVNTVATMLRRFHASGSLRGDFSAWEVPHRHRAAAHSLGVTIPLEFDRAALVAAEIEHAFQRSSEPWVACHNDLLGANFLAEHERLWLLDWEYAGNNDRYFDLANFAVNNELDADGQTALLVAYFGEVTQRRATRLSLMTIMSDFREAMWAVVQQGISTIDFDYRDYSQRHFDRLLRSAARPEYRSQLEAAATPESMGAEQ